MASLDSLPADQRAVIQLVLQQGRRYDDIAAMLSIDRAGVRQRALDAFDALGPDNSIPAAQRALLTDYLLGQLPPRVADQVHDAVAEDPAQRAWLRVVASEVGGLATAGLPTIPAPGARRDGSPAPPSPPAPTRRTGPVQAAPPAAPAAETTAGTTAGTVNETADQTAAETGRPRRSRPGSGAAGGLGGSSRRGGAILLGAGAAVIIAAIVLILVFALDSGSSKPHQVASSGSTTPTSASTTGSSTSTTSGEKFLAHVNLNSPSGIKSRVGIAQVVSSHSTLGMLLVAQGMPANSKTNAYAVWLYNSGSDSHLVGFVDARVGKSGRLETEGALPSNAAHYKHILLTLETAQKPKTPGPIVLEGSLNLS